MRETFRTEPTSWFFPLVPRNIPTNESVGMDGELYDGLNVARHLWCERASELRSI